MNFNHWNIKDPQIANAVTFETKNHLIDADPKKAAKILHNATIAQMGNCALLGYISTLSEVAEASEINKRVDLTYDTVQNLPYPLLTIFGNEILRNTPVEKAMEITEKTVAAYLTYLAVNEHHLIITCAAPENISIEATLNPSTWAGIKITVWNNMRMIDFLQAAKQCIKYDGKQAMFLIEQIVKKYQLLTEVDLKTYGLDDACMSF